jgi:hypothetical protein
MQYNSWKKEKTEHKVTRTSKNIKLKELLRDIYLKLSMLRNVLSIPYVHFCICIHKGSALKPRFYFFKERTSLQIILVLSIPAASNKLLGIFL